MRSFADQKSQREIKQSRTFISENNAVSLPDTTNVGEGSHPLAVTFPVDSGLYITDLPSSLNIRKDDTKGRGLWSKDITFRKGSTILKTKPYTYVLSIPNLSSYCSYCIQPATSASEPLKRCTRCKQVWYCSSTCQSADWRLHKHECPAIVRWTSTSTAAASASSSSSENGSFSFLPPPEAVRALGRILFARKVLGEDDPWWKEIQGLQSHRLSLQPSVAEPYTQLAHSLIRYLGVASPTELEPYGLRSVAEIVDLISRFTTNAFTLTSPILTSLGVCLSPLVSLLNHSCQPNAIVVFPGSKTAHSQPLLNVIALKDIQPNEEILISYVDVTFATPERQETLQKSYNFTCACPLCSGTTTKLDQREVVLCPKDCGNGGRCLAPFGGSGSKQHTAAAWRCTSCNASYLPDAITKLEEKRRVGQEAFDKASKLLSSDPDQAFKITTNIIPYLAKDLPPSAHPLLNILRLHQTMLTDRLANSDPKSINLILDDAIRTAGLSVTGLTAILDEGDPILGIALAELGKLLAVDEPPLPPSNQDLSESFSFPPRGPPRLALALETLKRALESLKIGFGRENEGGAAGLSIREDVVKLEKEAQAWQHFVRNAWEDTVFQRKYEKK